MELVNRESVLFVLKMSSNRISLNPIGLRPARAGTMRGRRSRPLRHIHIAPPRTVVTPSWTGHIPKQHRTCPAETNRPTSENGWSRPDRNCSPRMRRRRHSSPTTGGLTSSLLARNDRHRQLHLEVVFCESQSTIHRRSHKLCPKR